MDCVLTPFDQDLGTDVVDGDEVTNSGASFSIFVDCISGDLDSILVSSHGSEVEVDPVTGEFSGEIEGTYTLLSYVVIESEIVITGVIGTGEFEADVEGLMVVDGTGPVLDDGNVITVSETIDGEWELEGSGFEAEGEISLELDFFDFDPFGGSLTGELEVDGASDDDDDDDDD